MTGVRDRERPDAHLTRKPEPTADDDFRTIVAELERLKAIVYQLTHAPKTDLTAAPDTLRPSP